MRTIVALRLLLIEDDVNTTAQVRSSLTQSGYAIDCAADVQQARLALTAAELYDVIIVDRMLPGGDGLELVETLRAGHDRTPVLVLTALGSIGDRVTGLKSGADDYLIKPFSMDELEARVEALARRATSLPVRIVIGDLVLDRLDRSVRRGTTVITLIPREFRLLELLMLSSPAVVSRTMLLEEVWGFRFDPGTNLIESHVSRLRSKIDRGGDPPLIHTVRGEGYVALAR